MKNIRTNMTGLLLASMLIISAAVSYMSDSSGVLQRTVVQRSEEGAPGTNEPQPRADVSTTTAVPAKEHATFKFLVTARDGMPARWDPCSTLTWGIDWRKAPVGFDRKAFTKEATQAMRELRAATGLEFRRTFGPGQKSIVIEFAPRVAMLTEDTLAYASVYFGETGTPNQITSSVITVDPTFRDRQEFQTPSFRSVLLHELGHAAGLDHTDASSEVMYPFAQDLVTFQQGDRIALEQLGAAQGCIPS